MLKLFRENRGLFTRHDVGKTRVGVFFWAYIIVTVLLFTEAKCRRLSVTVCLAVGSRQDDVDRQSTQFS